MVKKFFAVLITLSAITGTLATQKAYCMDWGLGGFYSSDFGGGYKASFAGIYAAHSKTPLTNFGIFFMLDFKYVDLETGLFYSGGKWEDYIVGVGTDKFKFSGFGMNFGAYFKCPINAGSKTVVLPLLGTEFKRMLTGSLNGQSINDMVGDFNTIWGKAGVGVDLRLTEKRSINLKVLYGARFTNKFEDNNIANFRYSYSGVKVDSITGHGLDIKAAVVFR